ncbi:hypothetical protein GP486_003719 [Trichoglossum hirsutum]|uniref:DASH complex subunit DUO1 n=1 Tax=Trichoglossum hirsutum TaxID=265104 RepID=A0A9P8RQA3_9PEZI|nr:hypothetical protein GP486_003719 [Trichoglossum hirsutum]
MATPNLERLDLSDTDTDELFASPPRDDRTPGPAGSFRGKQPRETEEPSRPDDNAQARQQESRYGSDEARVAMLQKELEGVREVNEVIEGVQASLERAKENMETVSRTVMSASTLLNTWIRILSQTEHNQRLILDPSWQGATQDILDVENEAILEQQAAERRELEEQQRKAAAAKRAAEDEQRQRAIEAGKGTRGAVRGARGRVGSRGAGSASGTGYVGVGGQGRARGTARGGSTAGRAGSGIGRGIGSTRARAGGQR